MKVALPVDGFIESIQSSLNDKQNLIIIAAPGAGKTTRIPPNLLSQTSKKILMLQPRRIAARASAERIAEENHWKLGNEVGYRVRFEDCTSPQTSLIVVTEALLMRELLKDPILSDYGIIILDEFHERNLYTDAGLAAIRELQQLQRPDLKMIVMSATIDPNALLNYLQPAGLIEIPGRTFPVEVEYEQQSQLLNTNQAFIDRVVGKIIEVSRNCHSDNREIEANTARHTLVFLPGMSEIQRVQKSLKMHPHWPAKKQNLFTLHGSLSLQDQHYVLHSPGSKVILATNVAETSLTIDGVDTVIDSGLSRELQWDQRRLFPWLKTTRISKASAEQRKGRAGRQFPGRCFRLWTKLDDQSMPSFAPPDISNQDLTELILTLISLGISEPKNFSWFEKPSIANLERSLQFLFELGVLENKTPPLKLSAKGQWMQKVPLAPRLASLLYEGFQKNQSLLAIQIAVLLNERDPWARESLNSLLVEAQDSDLIPRLQALNPLKDFRNRDLRSTTSLKSTDSRSTNFEFENSESSSGYFRTHNQVIKQLNRIISAPKTSLATEGDIKNQITHLLLSSFSDRIARRRRSGESTALVVGQKGVELSSQSLVREAEFFFCLSGHANDSNGNAIVDLAHPLSKSQLIEFYSPELSIKKEEQYFPEKDTWMSVEQKMFRDLPLEEPILKPLTITKENLVLMVRQSFEKWKQTLPSLIQWQLRLQMAQKLWPQMPWPELHAWEQETIDMACFAENSLQAIQQKNWSELFCYALSKEQKNLMVAELPESLTTPKGKTIALQYEPSGVVNLELKIQDAFGWKQTPKIAQGKIKLRMILLGPHMRPLQTTDDLESFWKGAYLEMRPALKARYPKHQWPESP